MYANRSSWGLALLNRPAGRLILVLHTRYCKLTAHIHQSNWIACALAAGTLRAFPFSTLLAL